MHFLALLASFAIAAAAVVGFFDRPADAVGVLVWLGAAAVLHDLVLLPAYSLIDRLTVGRLPRRRSRAQAAADQTAVTCVPYIRIPAALSGLLLLVFFPVIFGLGRRSELDASGIAEHGYLVRWLLVTGVMFALSGAAFVIASARAAKRSAGQGSPDPEPDADADAHSTPA